MSAGGFAARPAQGEGATSGLREACGKAGLYRRSLPEKQETTDAKANIRSASIGDPWPAVAGGYRLARTP